MVTSASNQSVRIRFPLSYGPGLVEQLAQLLKMAGIDLHRIQ
jgi:hypothetical protein